MASNARRAVRFFGTVHARVNAIRNEPARLRQDLLTPERFPAVLATSCVTGLIIGWQIMDRIQAAAVSFPIVHLTKSRWTTAAFTFFDMPLTTK